MFNDIQIRSGVIGGTLLSTALNINFQDLLFTAIMSVIGAVVSFFVSYILRKLFSDSDDSKKKSRNA
jgi:uncharacterized membrane protein YeaQ/YmgE (transglycosylase-associated protein family)